MRALLFTALASGSSLLEKTLFEDGDVEAAAKLPATSEKDRTLKFFIAKRFHEDFAAGLQELLTEGDPHAMPTSLLLGRSAKPASRKLSFKRTPTLRMADARILKILCGHANDIVQQYLANRYDFSEIKDIKSSENSELRHVLVNIWTLDPAILQKFFDAIGNNKISPAQTKKELLYLAKCRVPKAFGLVGDIYYYGLGEPVDLEKAMDYYITGKKLLDNNSILGIAKVLAHPHYNDLAGAVQTLKSITNLAQEPEAQYVCYKLLGSSLDGQSSGEDIAIALWTHLVNAAAKGYMPAVYEYALARHAQGSSAMQSMKSITDYSPFILKHCNEAYEAYERGNMRKAALLYLYIAEFNVPIALKNAFHILRTHKLFADQEAIMVRILHDLGGKDSRYHRQLGDCYYYGRGVERSYEMAASHYIYGAQSSLECAYNLVYMLENGYGLPRSLAMAWSTIKSEAFKRRRLYLLVFYTKIRLLLKRFFFALRGPKVSVLLAVTAILCTGVAFRKQIRKIQLH
ncbi:SEL1 protein [Pancytospora philotis]|nr:SEL1 protein [Pancytospora philotis]